MKDKTLSEYNTPYLCVGSNLGNKLENCRRGIAALTRDASTRLVNRSRIYQTEPVDYRNQDWFVNYAVKIATLLEPLDLLGAVTIGRS
ncbi:MAG: 2-amino-4-hydroxy-6-hydroxymethyldihydropteridine diphosphokinase [Desulfobacterales bacterium]